LHKKRGKGKQKFILGLILQKSLSRLVVLPRCCTLVFLLKKMLTCRSVAVNQNNTTPKERILKKVRQALIFKSKAVYSNIDLDSNVFAQPSEKEPLLETFARNLTEQQGQFVYCDNKFDFIDKLLTLTERKKLKNMYCVEEQLQQLLKDSGVSFSQESVIPEKTQVGITSCEALVARTGSILVSSIKNGRAATIYPPVHIVVAYTSQVVMEMKEAMPINPPFPLFLYNCSTKA